jgi:hypothetical protein
VSGESLRHSWDSMGTHLQLARLTLLRGRFRVARTINRIRSPRRIVATTLAGLFFFLYLVNGVFILSAREPANPERLCLWLSGGMVLYALYHCIRCAWSEDTVDLEMSDAATLWLGNAPIERSSLALYHVFNLLIPAGVKTLLLAVVLARDVNHVELLFVGVFTSLVLLEIVRLMIARWAAGLDQCRRGRFRKAMSLVGLAVGIQVVAIVMSITPTQSPTLTYILNGFLALGRVAASDTVQVLAVPWVSAAHLTVAEHYNAQTLLQLLASVCVLPLAILLLVQVDRWSIAKRHQRERTRLAVGHYVSHEMFTESWLDNHTGRVRDWADRWVPTFATDLAAVITRQWISVRRYRGTIAFSFIIPMVLCLSPLVTGQVTEQWLYVVIGVALCTMLLAPPALRIDFRRDLRRMQLLRSLPVKPISMVIGQLSLPIAITWVYQWITIAIAAIVTQPGLSQLLLWTGMLNAFTVFTFAAENALFLAYPYHERNEGVAMMVRTKLTFLGKGTVIGVALGLLIVWATVCRTVLPEPLVNPTLVAGALAASWSVAAAAIFAATWCWKRFDLSCDLPPA